MPMRETRTASPPVRFTSIEEFLKYCDGVRGAVEIEHSGIPLHLFYDWRGADTTLVTFSGAVSTRVIHVPAFTAFGISSGLGLNRLLISDPSIALSTDLTLAWYGGNKQQPHLQDDLTRLINGVATGTRIILFGPSGGGFASLVQAPRLRDATAVVSNPQVDMRRYTRSAVERYLSVAWGMSSTEKCADLPFVADASKAWECPVDATVVYVQNAGDGDHMKMHYAEFARSCHPDNKVVHLLPELGAGHVGPDKGSFRPLLQVVRDNREWLDLARACHDLQLTRYT